jgi:hypothetical protein
MQPFKRAEFLEPDRRKIKHLAKSQGCSMNQVKKEFEKIRREHTVYLNDTYQVNVKELESKDGWPEMFWLSIKRRDKDVIRDWRELQLIKNLIVGPEHEGVELFPAESRLVDTSNQYHLWVLKEPGLRFPFGFTEREVVDGTGEIEKDGARQRPL